jgi:hypothetical protein
MAELSLVPSADYARPQWWWAQAPCRWDRSARCCTSQTENFGEGHDHVALRPAHCAGVPLSSVCLVERRPFDDRQHSHHKRGATCAIRMLNSCTYMTMNVKSGFTCSVRLLQARARGPVAESAKLRKHPSGPRHPELIPSWLRTSRHTGHHHERMYVQKPLTPSPEL